jgi:DEAD/DEAH box helicase domain-containing protein
MDTASFLGGLASLTFYQGQVVHIERLPPRMAVYGDAELSPSVRALLKEKGLFPLYRHQAQALDYIRRGENVVVATPSASGKTLVYNLAAIEALQTSKRARALYLFPTKALAQDQWRKLKELGLGEGETYDGDTPWEARGQLRRKARLILTNPDMLHVGILPNHASWAPFFRHLKLVVVDEAHAYRGVFGSHVAQVLRRLRRIAELYGSRPQFVLSSATLANPREHAENLVGLPFQAVTEDGSPSGGKDFVFWNPPFLDPSRSHRRSPNSETADLLSELVTREIRTLVFARSRRLTELIYIYARDRLKEKVPGLAPKLRPYRAGYLPELRREIEQGLFDGELLGVVATTALELGVDIGTLDTTVLNGYPGSIASAWQQAGRSGRRGERSLSFLIARDDPLDQYFMRHPEDFFRRPVEHALINLQNPYILALHLLCAAWEFPLQEKDGRYFGEGWEKIREGLEEKGLLRPRQDRWYSTPQLSYPAQDINIRSTSERPYAVVDLTTRELLETVEAGVAFFQVHPGAVYLHQGESYIIRRLDLEARTAYAEPTDADYYTQTLELEDLRVLRVLKEKAAGTARAYLGEVEVTIQVVGYRRKRQFTDEVIGSESLDLPPIVFPTMAFWFDLAPGSQKKIEEEDLDLAGGLHAAEHACIGLLPLFALCDRNDIGGVSTPQHADTGRAEVFIYDGHPGGVGIAEKGYELVEELWRATEHLVEECPCEDGCPSCIQSPKCGNNNQPLDKKAAALILRELMGR